MPCLKLCKKLLFAFTGFTTSTFSNKGNNALSISSQSCSYISFSFLKNLTSGLSFIFWVFRWYQIKISMRWEDSEYTSLATPARVVQYEGKSKFNSYCCCFPEFLCFCWVFFLVIRSFVCHKKGLEFCYISC